jgi:hypothetical protein
LDRELLDRVEEKAATKTAVIHFQRAAHLKPGGLWGTKSQAALDKMLYRHEPTIERASGR